jgi:hypothetical protein
VLHRHPREPSDRWVAREAQVTLSADEHAFEARRMGVVAADALALLERRMQVSASHLIADRMTRHAQVAVVGDDQSSEVRGVRIMARGAVARLERRVRVLP